MADERVQRRLAAILHADVAGYSRLTHEDETGTHQALQVGLNRLRKSIERSGGRVINLAGDALLAEFGSVVDCVTAAIDVQTTFAADNADQPEGKRLLFRIGVNLGEVIVDGSEIYGEGVNIAARLEALADPGGICLSGAVADQVRHRIDADLEDMGDQLVKNIDLPIRAYKVVLPTALRGRTKSARITERPSVAVLAFDNLSGDPDQEYFSDGVTEDIITALSRVGWLWVAARNSSFSYKGHTPDVRDVAKDLDVRYVLEGSIRKVGDRVRVTAQLIDGISGHHIWAERYDRDLDDIFALQDSITSTVVGAIQPELEHAEIQRARRKPSGSLDAWDLYQRGKYHLYRLTATDLEEARTLFLKAIEYDPELSAAYAGLSQTQIRRAIGGHVQDRVAVLNDAAEAARTAVELDRDDVNAQAALCRALIGQGFTSGAFDEAIDVGRQVVKQFPNSSLSHYQLGRAYEHAGQPAEAIAHLEEMLRLSPRDQLRGPAMAGLAAAYFDLEDYEKTLEWTTKALRAQPNLSWFRRLPRVCALASLGRLDQATQEKEAILARFPEIGIGVMIKSFGGVARTAKLASTLREVGFPE